MRYPFRDRLMGIMVFETSEEFFHAAYELRTRDARLAYLMGGEL